jgi:hypothetical protein
MEKIIHNSFFLAIDKCQFLASDSFHSALDIENEFLETFRQENHSEGCDETENFVA